MRQLHWHISGSPYEGGSWKGKRMLGDLTTLFRASIFSMLVGLELGIHTEEVCSSDEWQMGLYEE